MSYPGRIRVDYLALNKPINDDDDDDDNVTVVELKSLVRIRSIKALYRPTC